MKKYILPEIDVCQFKAVDIVTNSSSVPEVITPHEESTNEHIFSSNAGVEYIG